MNPAALGPCLAAAVGIAISPVAIAATLLLLLSPRAKTASVGFLLGWMLGIGAAVTAFALLAAVIPERAPGAGRTLPALIQLAVGVILLGLATVIWLRRPDAGGPGRRPPMLLRVVDRASPPVAFAVGAIMAVNPPNLLLSLSGGLAAGTAGLTPGRLALVLSLFTVVAASTVLVPVLVYFVAGARARGPVDAARAWLTRRGTLVLAAALAAVGALAFIQGIIALGAG